MSMLTKLSLDKSVFCCFLNVVGLRFIHVMHKHYWQWNPHIMNPMEQRPWYNKPYWLFGPVIEKCTEKKSNIMNPCCNQLVFPVPWQFVVIGFHCTTVSKELRHDILRCFFFGGGGVHWKLLLIGRKPLNNSLPG